MLLRRVLNWKMMKVLLMFLTRCRLQFRSGFTLAEVLITLGIIGVVSAITMPTLVTNCQKMITKVRVKKTFATLAQTTYMAEAEDGPVSTWDLDAGQSWEVARSFTEDYIAPYLKVAYKCPKNYNAANCNYQMYGLNGKKYSGVNNKTYRFYLVDGTFVAVWAFNMPSGNHPKRASIFIDINRPKGENKVGKDIFKLEYLIVSKTKTSDKIGKIAPAWIDESRKTLLSNKNEMCHKNQDGTACLAVIYKDGWEIASDYPW